MFTFSSRLGGGSISKTSTLLFTVSTGAGVDVLTHPLCVFTPNSKLIALSSGDSDLVKMSSSSSSNVVVAKSTVAETDVVLAVVLADATIFSKTLCTELADRGVGPMVLPILPEDAIVVGVRVTYTQTLWSGTRCAPFYIDTLIG